jgi:phage baseplate assembly protein W
MPIPQTIRVNPLDLQKNISIGVSLPFNGPAGPFNKTYSTEEQIKSNLINLLLTNKGERVFNPEFGADLKTVLFEGITEDTVDVIRTLIGTNVSTFIPEVTVTNLDIVKSEDTNTISVTVQYRINISGNANQITVEFI